MDVVVAEHLSKTYQAGAVAVPAVREASFAIAAPGCSTRASAIWSCACTPPSIAASG